MPADDPTQLVHGARSGQTERVQARGLNIEEEVAVDLREGVKQPSGRVVALAIRALLKTDPSLSRVLQSASSVLRIQLTDHPPSRQPSRLGRA